MDVLNGALKFALSLAKETDPVEVFLYALITFLLSLLCVLWLKFRLSILKQS